MKSTMTRSVVLGLALLLATASSAQISTTKHNLSVSGSGTVRASSESQICIFCHTPHGSAPNSPLWNRNDPGKNYTLYSSSTARANPGQPTGASILCLSCHDGTIALGDVLSRSTNIGMSGGVTTIPNGPGRLGTDLSDDHPISFTYNGTLATQNGELANPASLTGAVKLDSNGQLQCTSCHNPHDDANGKFLVMNNIGSALCNQCHQKNHWTQSSHNTSNATWNNSNPDPWPDTSWTTVSDNACRNCHKPHTAPQGERLLKHVNEEDNCLVCHNGNVATHNLNAEFLKFSYHPITNTTGVHTPTEGAVVNSRHVECVDCHNPHAARSGGGTPSGPLTGVRGVNIGGTAVGTITRTYELCLRCHGDSNGKPAARTQRQVVQTNVSLEFNTANPSYHPVAGPGKNSNVPSLISPLTTNSTISCLDCHNNNNGPGVNGSGPNGPHGSAYAPILERQYLTQDPTTESPSAYALCYKCHDRNSILGNNSFSRHSLHIGGGGGGMGGGGMGGLNTPCNVCHDPHGISYTQGNSTNHSKLINFDTQVVSPSSSNILRFESTGTFSGRCYLTCHGQNHNPKSYGGGMGGGGMGG